jgi:hypothetical protein
MVNPSLTVRGPSVVRALAPLYSDVYSAYKRRVESGEHKTSNRWLRCSTQAMVRRNDSHFRDVVLLGTDPHRLLIRSVLVRKMVL